MGWLQRLPLVLGMGSFRIAHACWSDAAIDAIRAKAPDGVLRDDLLLEAADADCPFGAAVDVVAKGPEADMPEGCSFIDRTGVRRTRTASPGGWEAIALVMAVGALAGALLIVLHGHLKASIGPRRTVVLLYLVPLYNIALAAAVLGESLAWYQATGAVLLLSGIFLTTRPAGARAAVGRGEGT